MRQLDNTIIFIGSKKEAEDQSLLKSHNIRAVLAVDDKTEFKKVPGVLRFHIWMSDPEKTLAPNNPIHEAAQILEIIYSLMQKRGGNILVHCVHGHNRSAIEMVKGNQCLGF